MPCRPRFTSLLAVRGWRTGPQEPAAVVERTPGATRDSAGRRPPIIHSAALIIRTSACRARRGPDPASPCERPITPSDQDGAMTDQPSPPPAPRRQRLILASAAIAALLIVA